MSEKISFHCPVCHCEHDGKTVLQELTHGEHSDFQLCPKDAKYAADNNAIPIVGLDNTSPPEHGDPLRFTGHTAWVLRSAAEALFSALPPDCDFVLGSQPLLDRLRAMHQDAWGLASTSDDHPPAGVTLQ